ncbi:putative unusual protein kinase regulating ubiquinone biosynthesis (AarF/ABC1/UbiB family) [Stella humosa]|uniref:Putative unusual protein kinase regulating ubiquinone biosynthesis (AarF/ABC1/UbiB family) n=1 Tax=Stella humosa TaxID=94 RepID=A0A3N1KR41_9PROT|nr:AarF/ABC1/UbiB kinase family protein [Stella humosa]ROP83121.1 putative unusual protein kinase regulating ubiquinone biosynthesis (AarF/ABC1/UbiB family) [Stella humosa]BBK30102.1 ABC transporter ATP-binding protein [Stella humosa]
MASENSFGGRLRRYAQVSTTVGGVAARVAGGRLFGMKGDQDRQAADLRAALGGIKGPLMKVAQMLSTIPDALPDAYVRELQQLQAHAPAMGWPFVRRRMTSELGEGWRARFAEFEREAARAASLGQVHRATALDGRLLACKLQYPDMGSAVEADLRQLGLAFSIYQRYDRSVGMQEIRAEITDRLREELDYRREARHMGLYGRMLKGEAGVHVPEALPELSTDRLLTMTWLEGTSLAEAETAPVERRNAIARNLFQAWYVPFYRYGVIHGDPHLGNYTLGEGDAVNLLDFGCIRIFRPSFVAGVIDLYKALRDEDEALAVHAYETWGFVAPSRELIAVMNRWARFVYSPLMVDRTQPIQASKSGLYGAEVAAGVHKELRRIGGVTPPREFVLMDRAAIGLGSVFLRLGAELNWHRLFHGLVDDFDRKALEKRQKTALKAEGLEPAA